MISAIIPTVLHYVHGWGASPSSLPFLVDPKDPAYKDYMEWAYVKPWNRFSPYIIGILLGYLLHRTKGKQIKISKVSIYSNNA